MLPEQVYFRPVSETLNPALRQTSSRLASKSVLCRKLGCNFWKPATLKESVRSRVDGIRDYRKALRLGDFGKLVVSTIRRADADAKLLGDLWPGPALLT
jgi:hypothetical protein